MPNLDGFVSNINSTFNSRTTFLGANIDWVDIISALCIGIYFVGLRGHVDHHALTVSVNLLCFAYIGFRVSSEPHKMGEWGLRTKNLLIGSVVSILAITVFSVFLAAISFFKTNAVPFDIHLIGEMVAYTEGAFPQQFLIFGMVCGNLLKLPIFSRGLRLPILAGILFSAGHWHAPYQMFGTMFLGFFCVYFYMRFKNIFPLILMHACLYPLYEAWYKVAINF